VLGAGLSVALATLVDVTLALAKTNADAVDPAPAGCGVRLLGEVWSYLTAADSNSLVVRKTPPSGANWPRSAT
jgi:hypothetical protein